MVDVLVNRGAPDRACTAVASVELFFSAAKIQEVWEYIENPIIILLN